MSARITRWQAEAGMVFENLLGTRQGVRCLIFVFLTPQKLGRTAVLFALLEHCGSPALAHVIWYSHPWRHFALCLSLQWHSGMLSVGRSPLFLNLRVKLYVKCLYHREELCFSFCNSWQSKQLGPPPHTHTHTAHPR